MKATSAVRFLVLAAWLRSGSAQDANCDYSQYAQPGQTYYVYSPGYPAPHRPGVACRWIGTCPAGYNCQLNCSVIDMPQSQDCAVDRLLVSLTGDPLLAGAAAYCGRRALLVTSTRQQISIGLLSSNNSPGGRFLCTLRAVPITQPPNTTCSCGWKKTNRIVGGSPTGVNEYPAMAGLVDVAVRQIRCGGAVLSERYVASAAHCLLGHNSTSLAVIVGEHDITTGDSPATQLLRISRIVSHPGFNSNNFNNDIGIITTATPIVFSDRVGPVCLPFKYTGASFSGATVEALGWGTLFPGGPTSDVLMKVALDVISNDKCRTTVSSVASSQLCTYTPGKDSCQDDSGGPLLYQEPTTGWMYLVGVISLGHFCASEKPAVNTRVTSYLGWIEANTPGALFCRKS